MTLTAASPPSSGRRPWGLALSFTLLLALLASAATLLATAAPVYDGPSVVVVIPDEDGEFHWNALPFLSDPELTTSGSIRCSTPLNFESDIAILGGPGRSGSLANFFCLYTIRLDRFCELDAVMVAAFGGQFTPFEVKFVSSLSGCQSVLVEDEPQTLLAALFSPAPPAPLDQPSSERSSLVIPLLAALVVLAAALVLVVLYLVRLKRRSSQAIPIVVSPSSDDPLPPLL